MGGAITAYALLQIAYNLRLKRMVILDIGAIATGFVLRADAGAAATGIVLSAGFLSLPPVLYYLTLPGGGASQNRFPAWRLLTSQGRGYIFS
ncbi:MAG: hypothetical protein V7K27_09305 [Nostoc sp.]|uniref:hypothetical protein n=1 Tax=Nostoc sp. TaxID=1180 RepID=UPI002FF747ED